MKIIDISLPISPGMPVYPGTMPTSFTQVKSGSGQSRLTNIHMHSHAGSHVDAQAHIRSDGTTVDEFELVKFYGPCRVLELLECTDVITREALESKVIQGGERILLKTRNSSRGYTKFYDEWIGLSSDAAEYLSDLGVMLVGIDWYGIKQKSAPDNLAHSVLLDKSIPIIEGLNLALAQEDHYMLSAFPLALQGTDGAPLRAVLIKESDS